MTKLKEKILAEWVSDCVDKWLALPRTPFGHNAWIENHEGKVYIRYNAFMEKLDLASFEIKPRYRKKGVAKAVIEMAVKKDIKIIRIENISVPGWARKILRYKFPGRKVVIIGEEPGDLDLIAKGMTGKLCCVTVDFVRE